MRTKLYVFTVLLGMIPLSSLAQPQSVPKGIKIAVTAWQPTSLTMQNGIVTVVTPQNRMTENIYKTVATSVCGNSYGNKTFWGKTPIKEIHVLNQFGTQGYIWENPKQTCQETAKLVNEKEVTAKLMGNTRLR